MPESDARLGYLSDQELAALESSNTHTLTWRLVVEVRDWRKAHADARRCYPVCASCGGDLIPHDGELCGGCANGVLSLLAEARAWVAATDKNRMGRRELLDRIDSIMPIQEPPHA